MWEYLCQMKLVALSACHNLYCQSHLSMALLINTSCLSFTSDLKHHDPLNATEKKPPWHVVLDNKITLLLKRKKNLICLFVSCIPHIHTQTHIVTHGWFGTAVLPATSSLSFLPLSPWRQASRAGWLQTVVNQHRLKTEDGEGVSLCLNMTERTLWALCYRSPNSDVIKVSEYSCRQMWKRDQQYSEKKCLILRFHACSVLNIKKF